MAARLVNARFVFAQSPDLFFADRRFDPKCCSETNKKAGAGLARLMNVG